ncbi:hypothetical protein H8959_015511 [Pygathrix nigripes]
MICLEAPLLCCLSSKSGASACCESGRVWELAALASCLRAVGLKAGAFRGKGCLPHFLSHAYVQGISSLSSPWSTKRKAIPGDLNRRILVLRTPSIARIGMHFNSIQFTPECL